MTNQFDDIFDVFDIALHNAIFAQAYIVIFTFYGKKEKHGFLANSHVNSIVWYYIHCLRYCTSINVALFHTHTQRDAARKHLECQRPIQCFLHVTLQLAIKIDARTIKLQCMHASTGFFFQHFSLITTIRTQQFSFIDIEAIMAHGPVLFTISTTITATTSATIYQVYFHRISKQVFFV